MFPKIDPTSTSAWKALSAHFAKIKNSQLKQLFADDKERFKNLSIRMCDILFDYSKNLVNKETLGLLLQLANECQVHQAMMAMFIGEKINGREDRAVLHTALRNFSGKAVQVDGKDVMPLVKKVQDQMRAFCNRIHSGEWKGFSGKKIRYIVNIGIGGSDLGPYM